MFGDKKNINILTSLLMAHGVRKAVVCPGSRNAPILHSLNECDGMTCYPVTDERSAGFYALGMSLADDNPVALCVTSGTALLNLAPAVAEATYRHHGLVIISADRPSAWIGQLDGQTLHQPDAFGCFVCKCVNLSEPHDDVEYWHCNRLVNEALLAVRSAGRGSVHINVPISEPLFRFNVERLPVERVINKLSARLDVESFRQIVCGKLLSASRPMLIVGQLGKPSQAVEDALRRVSTSVAVLSEPLSDGTLRPFDLVLASLDEDESLRPDFLLYVGDTVVSKRLKNFIRKSACTEIWAVTEDGDVHDTFMHMSGVVEGDTADDVDWLAQKMVNMRIFDDEAGVMNRSVVDVGGDVLAVSQFTLAASTKKGNRPSYIHAAGHELAVPLYERFCEQVQLLLGRSVARGQFGANMQVELVNDGPVTIIVDSKNKV